MDPTPIEALLAAIDRLDVDGAMSLCSPDCRLMTVDGRQAEGRDAARQLLGEFLSQVRLTQHEITEQWHFDGVHIAEAVATYELASRLRIERVPRVFVARTGPAGIDDLRVYGANEPRMSDRPTGQEPVRIGGRLILPL